MTEDLLAGSAPPGDLEPSGRTPGNGSKFAGAPGLRDILVLVRVLPAWLSVTAIWLASRVITTIVMEAFAASKGRTYWAGPHPNYLQLAEFWDSGWYHRIAVQGYPSTLPLSTTGHVLDNTWAFYPAYPEFVRALTAVTGISWDLLAIIVSLGFSLAGALMFHRLMRLSLPPGPSLFAVLLLCIAPLSAIQQVAYAESMGAFLLTLSLYLVMRRQYVWLLPVMAVMDLTRPVGPAFALFLVVHVVCRLVQEPFTRKSRSAAFFAASFSIAMAAAWPVIAWASTGSVTAYIDSELAWRARHAAASNGMPFEAWFAALWNLHAPVIEFLVVAAMVGFTSLLFFSRTVRRLGTDLRMWLGAYAIYLVAVFLPQSSTFRLLVPMSPLLGAAAVPRSRLWRLGLVVGSLGLQCLWIWFAWLDHGGGVWSPP
ncbi:MAG: hypothetical protein JWQ39_1585 [Glaciihabitans sp.]|nr:hypothetical protein [Glaciihabitans sp.]